jgi:hypothetical protein
MRSFILSSSFFLLPLPIYQTCDTPSSGILAFLAAAWLRYDTRGGGHLHLGAFYRESGHFHPIIRTFFHHLSWQAGRQGRAGQDGLSSRQAGGIMHCFCYLAIFYFFLLGLIFLPYFSFFTLLHRSIGGTCLTNTMDLNLTDGWVVFIFCSIDYSVSFTFLPSLSVCLSSISERCVSVCVCVCCVCCMRRFYFGSSFDFIIETRHAAS